MGKTCPGPHKGLGPIIMVPTRDPDTHRGHGKMGVYKDILLRDQPAEKVTFFLKNNIWMLFQISGAKMMYLKDYGISLFKEEKYDRRD